MKVFELAPVNGRKSFGGKCKVMQGGRTSKLLSYDTEVAEYDHEQNKIKILGYHSTTTGKHINAFLEFYGFDQMTKKEILASI